MNDYPLSLNDCNKEKSQKNRFLKRKKARGGVIRYGLCACRGDEYPCISRDFGGFCVKNISTQIFENVFRLYQSASGDAAEGTSVFTMEGGKMTAQSGAMFYCTNTQSVINLKNAALTLSENETLLIVSAGRWGKDGQNGDVCTLNAEGQTLTGDITVDAISSLKLDLTNSSYTGCITGKGEVDVTMDETSTWILTGDSYIASLSGNTDGIDLNGYALYVNGVLYE